MDIKHGVNPRIKAYTDNVGPADSSFHRFKADFHLDTWGDGSRLYVGSCVWLDISKHSTDFQFGTFSTGRLNKDNVLDVQFKGWQFDSVPKIVTWLSGFDVDKSAISRIFVQATNVTTAGFKLHVGTWLNSIVYDATVAWIAVPSDRSNMTAGNFDPGVVQGKPGVQHSKKITFDKPFKRAPRVVVALNKIDISNNFSLRVLVSATDITTEGVTLNIAPWLDTVLYGAGLSYLAIEDLPQAGSHM